MESLFSGIDFEIDKLARFVNMKIFIFRALGK